MYCQRPPPAQGHVPGLVARGVGVGEEGLAAEGHALFGRHSEKDGLVQLEPTLIEVDLEPSGRGQRPQWSGTSFTRRRR